MIPNNTSLFDVIDLTTIDNIFTENALLLEAWTHSIEQHLIESDTPARVYIGTQALRDFLPLLNTYQQIARHAEVFVFGEADDCAMPASDGITWIPLHHDDGLCHERFVIVNQYDFPRALVAQEICNCDERPRMRGLRTCNAATVHTLDERLGQLAAERISVA